MKYLSVFGVLIALLAVSSAQPRCRRRNPNPCADFCKFTFCLPDGSDTRTVRGPRLLLRDPNVATYPFVCTVDTSTRIGRIIRVGEAQVACANTRPREFVPITRYARGMVRPPFSRKYLRLRPITFPDLPGKYGISRLKSRGNQDSFVDDICVYFPLLRYELFTGSRRQVIRRVTREDCVGFRAVLGVLIIEFTWSAGDDFDLSVEEPNGNVISRLRPNSATGGRLIRDNNVGTCDFAPVGREQVTYRTRATPLVGRYRVVVRHFTACGPKVSYSLAIIANGKNKVFDTGETNVGGDNVVLTKQFNFP